MRPIYDTIKKYAAGNPARFHMPGHFGEGRDGLYASAPFDITELPFSDNLLNPDGIIRDSEILAAVDCGAAECLFFTAGSTSAVFAALGGARAAGDEIILSRASHKSVYTALSIFGFTPRYMFTGCRNGLPVPASAEDVSRAIEKYPDASAVLITSPDYFGRTSDVKAIAALCASKGKVLIADAAHGAHFPYSRLLPDSPSMYAGITVASFHKTLPVFSGGAALFCNDETLSRDLRATRSDLHTTSPSYLTLCSIDYALDKYRRKGEELYERLYGKIERLKKNLRAEFLRNDDFSRLVIRLGERGLALLSEHGVVPETVVGEWAVLIASPENTGALDRLAEALRDFVPGEAAEPERYFFPEPVFDEAYRFDVKGPHEYVPLCRAVGRTAAREIGLYPPGVPVVARGEIITAEAAEVLRSGVTFGFVNDRICVTMEQPEE